MFESEVFQWKMYCIEESTCDIIGTFNILCSHSAHLAMIWHPYSDLALGEMSLPCLPRYVPGLYSLISYSLWVLYNYIYTSYASQSL